MGCTCDTSWGMDPGGLKQMSKPSQLTPLDVEEQLLFFKPLLKGLLPYYITLEETLWSKPIHPLVSLYLVSFSHDTYNMTRVRLRMTGLMPFGLGLKAPVSCLKSPKS